MKHLFITILLCAILMLGLTACASNKTEESVLPPTVQKGMMDSMAEENAVPFPAAYFNAVFGNRLVADKSGYVIFASTNSDLAQKNMNIPEEYAHGVIVLSYEEEYYFKGKTVTDSMELVYFNIEPDESIASAIPERPVPVTEGTPLGTAFDDPGVIIRCNRLNEHLVSCSTKIPRYYDGNWYFDVESMISTCPKFLLYQPVSSRTDSITFHTDGQSETLEEITCRSEADDHPCSYPVEIVRFLTQLADYPANSGNARNIAEVLVQNQNFVDYYGNPMTLEVKVDFDGLVWHFMYPDYFIDYFMDEYTPGDDIYLYGNICYSLDGELWLFGRDYTLFNPDDEVDSRIKEITYANFGDNSLR